MFQPGEECNPGGASLVLAEKPFDGIRRAGRGGRARRTAAGGRDPRVPAGKYMAASDELRLRIRGTGGHGAMRSQLRDPVAAGAELLTRLIALNGEECVLSIGRVEAGGATNVVPDEVYMEGTLRTFDERERGIIHRRIGIIAADIDKRHGVRTDVGIGRGYPCVVNDEILVKKAVALARAEGLSVEMLPLRTTAEDFGFYCRQYPSLFYRLGVGAAAGRPSYVVVLPRRRGLGRGHRLHAPHGPANFERQ
ncbi:MAG: M20/M25/M40 family metallo-hydrolase [Alistipes senegalensis]